LSESRLIHCVSAGVFRPDRRRHVLRIRLRRRTACKTVVSISRPRRRRPQQARPVRFALPDSPVRRIAVRGLALRRFAIRRFAVRGITVRGLFVCRVAVRGRTVRRFPSPVRRRLVVRYLPVRRQDFRFAIRLLPVREDTGRGGGSAVTLAPPSCIYQYRSYHDVKRLYYMYSCASAIFYYINLNNTVAMFAA